MNYSVKPIQVSLVSSNTLQLPLHPRTIPKPSHSGTSSASPALVAGPHCGLPGRAAAGLGGSSRLGLAQVPISQ